MTPKHLVAGVDGSADGVRPAPRPHRCRFVVQRAHDDAVAQQATAAVDLFGGQAHAAQDGLPAVGLEAAERHGHIDDRRRPGRFAAAAPATAGQQGSRYSKRQNQ